MVVKYDKLFALMNRKGESFNSLRKKGVITDHTSRLLSQGEYVSLKHIASICRYFDVPIEDIVEVIPKDES